METLSATDFLSDCQSYSTGVWLTDFANFSSLVFHHFSEVNWAGFYLDDGLKLRLGPFCGRPACTEIDYTRGVCGEAFRLEKVLRVANVHEFPGHIACDPRSKSEIVFPLYFKKRKLGVFDVDSPIENRFSEDFQKLLQNGLDLLLTQPGLQIPQDLFGFRLRAHD